jgi:hypothetical protein
MAGRGCRVGSAIAGTRETRHRAFELVWQQMIPIRTNDPTTNKANDHDQAAITNTTTTQLDPNQRSLERRICTANAHAVTHRPQAYRSSFPRSPPPTAMADETTTTMQGTDDAAVGADCAVELTYKAEPTLMMDCITRIKAAQVLKERDDDSGIEYGEVDLRVCLRAIIQARSHYPILCRVVC